MGALPSEERHRELEADVAGLVGIINAAHGRLADLVADAVDEGIWEGWQIHSPGHWLAWKTAMAPRRAHQVAHLASRRAELPETFAALRAGSLSLDAGIEIAKRAPSDHEQSIVELAPKLTINQLRATLRDYAYGDGTDDPRKKPEHPDRRSVSKGRDDHGFWFNGRLDDDEAAVYEQALQVARDDLIAQARAACAPGETPAPVTWADAAVAVAEGFLRAGEAAHPGSDRYLVHLHLDARATPDGIAAGSNGAALSFHLGGPVPAALQSLLLCGDIALRPTFWDRTSPLSVGRKTRVISRRMRRAIEHRDGGCRVPGCGRIAARLDIHHILHWEHGGSTDTANLVCLCRRHHRLHHNGLLGIAGNADQVDDQAEDPLRFTDHWHQPLAPVGAPVAPGAGAGQSAAGAAAAASIAPSVPFEHPYGEQLDRSAIYFSRNRPRPVPDPSTDHGRDDRADERSGPVPTKPTGPGSNNNTTWFGPGAQPRTPPPQDPRHGGPPTSSSPPAA